MPEFESFHEALIECVKACGGSKRVGPMLWPGKTIDAAQRHLLACLNEDKPERLCPDDLLHLLRLSRERGCHAGMQYLAATLSYAEPQPVEPKDEADDLRRQYIEATRSLLKMGERIEQLERRNVQAVRVA